MDKMSKVQTLRASVEQRISAAVEEIFGLFERTITEYEEQLCRSKEENERKQKLLDAVWNPRVLLNTADIHLPPEQQQWSPGLDQEDPGPLHIKEEQEELWTNQEAHTTMSPPTLVPVKSEDDEEEAQSSQLHQRQTEENKEEPDGEDCGGPGPDGEDCGGPGPDGEDCGGPEPHMNLVHIQDFNSRPAPNSRCPFSKSKNRRSFDIKSSLERHMDTTRDRPFGSSVRVTRFSQKENTTRHISCVVDTKPSIININDFTVRDVGGEMKPHRCSECSKTFKRRSHLLRHKRIHTGEKPFSCSDCGKRFSRKSHLVCHVRVHTGETPYSCSVCKRCFKDKSKVRIHMVTHTGEKHFGCSVCGKKFSQKSNLITHMKSHSGEKPFSCTVCNRWFSLKGNLQAHMKIHTRHKTLSS